MIECWICVWLFVFVWRIMFLILDWIIRHHIELQHKHILRERDGVWCFIFGTILLPIVSTLRRKIFLFLFLFCSTTELNRFLYSMFGVCYSLFECMWIVNEKETTSGLCLTLDLVNGNAMSRFFFLDYWCVIFVAAVTVDVVVGFEFGIIFNFIEHSRPFLIFRFWFFHMTWHRWWWWTKKKVQRFVYFRCLQFASIWLPDCFYIYMYF